MNTVTRENINVNNKRLDIELRKFFGSDYNGLNYWQNPEENISHRHEFIFENPINESDLDNIISNHVSDDYTNFIYNDDAQIHKKTNFRKWYGLKGNVDELTDVNEFGDVIKIEWQKDGKTAICEDRVYTRIQAGVEPNDTYTLTKQTTIKFFREASEGVAENDLVEGIHFETLVLNKEYNDKERKDKDEKSRHNLLEKTRTEAGMYIAGNLISQNMAAEIPAALAEAKLIFDNLNKEINQYKFERLNLPLVTGINDYLTNFPVQTYVDQPLLDFIKSKIDVEPYIAI